MRNEYVALVLVLLGQLLRLRVSANPMPWWNPMQYQPPMPYNPQFYPAPNMQYPYPNYSQTKDKVNKPSVNPYNAPAFQPNFYAQNTQYPYPNYYYNQYYQGMYPPPNPSFANQFPTGKINKKKNDDDDDDDKKHDDKEERQDDDPKPVTIQPTYSNYMPGYYAPGYGYPSYFPAAQPNQNMYPGYQANQYAYPQQQEQQQQQQNDEPKFSPPPPPKIPELMSTLVQLSKNKKKYGYLDGGDSCSSCKTCNQCYKSPKCASCSLCQSKLCDEAQASLPMIPKDVRPLWEQWSERTADMNSMEMSGLIFESPKKWLKKLGIKTGGSKRSHINSSKKADKKTHKKAATKKQ